MKKILLSLLAFCLSNLAFAQSSQSLSSATPLQFTSTGTGTYNKTVLYHSYTYGFMLELARTSDLLSANPIDFRISARGNNYSPFFIKGSDGNVGIGTISPSSSLHINSSNSRGLKFSRTGANDFGYEIGGSTFGLYDYTDGEYRWKTENGNVILNESGGNVGIGTASPDNTLHVEGDLLLDVFGNSGHEKGIFFREGFSTTNKYNVSILAYDHNAGVSSPDGISINGYDGISFNTGSNTRNERMRIALDGNVGIGTTSPLSKLEIKDSQDASFDSGLGITRSAASQTGYLNMVGGAFNFNSPDGLPIKFRDGGNTNLTIQGDGNVGIGTTSPDNTLHVEGDLLLDVFGNSGHEKGIFFREGFSTTNKYNVSILAYDHNGGGTSPDGLSINGADGVSFSTGSDNRNERMRVAQNGNVGIGTTSPTEKLSVDGTVLAKKVRVSVATADWPDYVFDPSYELLALSELESYIKLNQHLPEVLSAKEVIANGLDLGGMDATLLKKVEELTLYTIDQEKKITQQSKENQELKDRLLKIEAILKTLTSK